MSDISESMHKVMFAPDVRPQLQMIFSARNNCRIRGDSPEVRVTNSLGTDLRFSVKGRKWKNDNGDISKKGEHGNLPAGECYTCPVEGTFTGRIIFGLIDDKVGRGE